MDGGYIVPIRVSVQRAEQLTVGDVVTMCLEVRWGGVADAAGWRTMMRRRNRA
jgi:hypothetical protein